MKWIDFRTHISKEIESYAYRKSKNFKIKKLKGEINELNAHDDGRKNWQE